MRIVKPSFEILSPVGRLGPGFDTFEYDFDSTENAFINEAKLIEKAGRTAYKSEDKITADGYDKFIRNIISRGHEAVIEFGSMAVKFITDRGATHELVRHRLCSFVQESTRYCNYSSDKFDNEITFIEPSKFAKSAGNQYIENNQYFLWKNACKEAEEHYLALMNSGETPQIARSVLPNSLKTEIVVRANFREWRHIFQLRAIEKAAHPDMRALMLPLYQECRKLLPCVFEMGEPE